ncbi:unnamed protein product [Ectocarpus sp. 8 AP-2014]
MIPSSPRPLLPSHTHTYISTRDIAAAPRTTKRFTVLRHRCNTTVQHHSRALGPPTTWVCLRLNDGRSRCNRITTTDLVDTLSTSPPPTPTLYRTNPSSWTRPRPTITRALSHQQQEGTISSLSCSVYWCGTRSTC